MKQTTASDLKTQGEEKRNTSFLFFLIYLQILNATMFLQAEYRFSINLCQ